MSIFKKLTFLFIFSFILMSIIGLWIDNINSKRVENISKENYLQIVDNILKNIENKSYINRIVLNNGLKRIDEFNSSNLKNIYFQESILSSVSIFKDYSSNKYIIHIKYLDEDTILETLEEDSINDKLIFNILVFLDIFALILIFLYITKLLFPLKTITKNIKKFANGDLSTRVNIDSNDEIGVLADNFNSMASSLENSIKAREELLRDIGHELRTPIAKGKFAIEKIENFKDKKLLKDIFLDLERLTNELIELEKLNFTKLNLTSFSAETLILESLKRLYLEDESKISIEISEDFKIEADLYYLSIAIKNLIDNALKYTKSFPIFIKISKNQISILNKADKLSKEFEYYLKPFTQELNQRDGFGLGLSIVKKILDRHSIILNYSHKDDFNSFKVVF